MPPEQVEWIKNKGNKQEVYTDLESVDPIVKSINDKFLDRSSRGKIKYHTTLFENNKDNYLNHLLEELMDAVLYIQKLKQQTDDITDIVKTLTNDQELGMVIRSKYSK